MMMMMMVSKSILTFRPRSVFTDIYPLSSFSRLSSWSKLLVGPCYSIFHSWPTRHFLPVWGWVRETTTFREKTKNYVGPVSTKFSPCFSFSASQISRYDVSPDLRSTIFLSAFPPLQLKQRGAEWNEHHRISETWFAMLGVHLSN